MIVGGVLVMTGNPQPCADREIPISPAAAQSLKDKWDAFAAQAAAGQASGKPLRQAREQFRVALERLSAAVDALMREAQEAK